MSKLKQFNYDYFVSPVYEISLPEGVVKVTRANGGAVVKALPISSNIHTYPLQGEQVLVFSMGGDNYYYPFPINFFKNSHHNIIEGNDDLGIEGFIESETTRNVSFEATDLILDGRYDTSIRLGRTSSDRNEGNSNDGLIIIRCNDDENYTDNEDFALEDINNDSTSIYITTNQIIDIELANDNFKSIKN